MGSKEELLYSPKHGDIDTAAAKTTTATCAAKEQQPQKDDYLTKSFDEMPLDARILRGIYAHGFERPSPIQQRAVLPIIGGGDVLAQAPSGTGKTGAFSIGLLQRLDPAAAATQAVVLSPTRELAQQTHEILESIAEYLFDGDGTGAGHAVRLFVGGGRTSRDVEHLTARPAGCKTPGATLVRVAVGTPGRIHDLVKRGALRASSIRLIVLDEADTMLSQGFAEQVTGIFRFVPRDVQVVLVSATMPPEVVELAHGFLRSPEEILMAPEDLTLDGIAQHYVKVTGLREKMVVLHDLYETVSIAQSVIFVNRRETAAMVAEELGRHHHTVGCLHSDLTKQERQAVMTAFRAGHLRVLVATDIAARGIDVQHVNIVINVELPITAENYLHRIGRSGRYGRRGLAINLVSGPEMATLHALERHYKKDVPELPADFAAQLGAEV